jgi:hypothetical protein
MWRGLLVLLVGCGGQVGQAGVLPAVGLWSYEDEGVRSNTCPEDLYRDPDASFWLSDVSATGFTITEEEAFECALDGARFECPERRRIELPVGETILSWTVSVSGSFKGPDVMEGEQRFEVSCTGGLCALDEAVLGVSLPCAYVVGFSARR